MGRVSRASRRNEPQITFLRLLPRTFPVGLGTGPSYFTETQTTQNSPEGRKPLIVVTELCPGTRIFAKGVSEALVLRCRELPSPL